MNKKKTKKITKKSNRSVPSGAERLFSIHELASNAWATIVCLDEKKVCVSCEAPQIIEGFIRKALQQHDRTKRGNSIHTITPYKNNGMWVFDDEKYDLKEEALIGGTDEIMEILSSRFSNGNESQRFLLLFSANPFPAYQYKFDWVEGDEKGNIYSCDELKMEGWLCPALFHYFPEGAPSNLYIKAEKIHES